MINSLQQFINDWKDTNCYDRIKCPVCGRYFRRGIGLQLHLYTAAHYSVGRAGPLDPKKVDQEPRHLELRKMLFEEEKKLPWWWRFTTYSGISHNWLNKLRWRNNSR